MGPAFLLRRRVSATGGPFPATSVAPETAGIALPRGSGRALTARGRLRYFLVAALLLTATELRAGTGWLSSLPARWEIAEIQIQNRDIYDEDNPAERGWVYRLVNRIHFTTRESFLRQALPLAPGQKITYADIQEAERILRRFSFLREVRIEKRDRPDGRIDLVVITRDSWTTKIGISAGGGGGETRLRLGLEESNLLGFGRSLAFEFDRTSVRTTKSVSYEDPRFLNSNRKFELRYLDNSDGSGYSAKLSLPLLRGADPFGWSIEGIRLTEWVPVYDKGEVSYRIERKTTALEAEAIWTLSGSALQTLRAGVGFAPRREDFGETEADHGIPPFGPLSVDRRQADIYFLLQSRAFRFRSEAYINRFARVEDIATGLDGEVRVGVSPEVLAGDEDVWLFNGSLAGGFDTFRGNFGTARVEVDIRRGARDENQTGRIEAEATGYFRLSGPLPHALGVAHVHWINGWRLQPQERLLLGGDTGLRGYDAHAFDGQKRFLMNLEYRTAWEREWFHLVQLGAAAFLDTGIARDHDVLHPSNWKTSAGIGLRFGIPRAARNNVLRLDVSWPFAKDDRGKSGYVISFGSGQAF
jgi:hemolysin activation/secretion protein